VRRPAKLCTKPIQIVQILQPLENVLERLNSVKGRKYRQHNDSKPKTRTQAFHHHIGWDLSSNVEGEEDGKSGVVLEGTGAFGRHA
jgi:hypothetical protein